MKPDFKIPLKYGLIGGFVLSVISLLTYVFYESLFSSFMMMIVFRFAVFAVVIFVPIMGGITYRRLKGGSIPFVEAFVAVFIVYAISSLMSTAMIYLIPNVIDEQYPVQMQELVRKTTEESMEKWGKSQDEIDKALRYNTLEQYKPGLATVGKTYAFGLVFGAILSAIIAAFTRRSEKPPVEEETPAS